MIPSDEDAHDIKKYRKDALAQPETRKEFYKYLCRIGHKLFWDIKHIPYDYS